MNMLINREGDSNVLGRLIIFSCLIFYITVIRAFGQTLEFPYFDSFPSDQGWTYRTDYEGDIFYMSNGILIQNSIGTDSTKGFFLIERGRVIHSGTEWTLTVNARIIEIEDTTKTSGFFFNVVQDSWLYSVRLTPTKIYISDVYPDIFTVIPCDNTIFHEYMLVRNPGAKWVLFVDDSKVSEGIPVPAFYYSYIDYELAFGDGTSRGNVNAHGEWASYSFSQKNNTLVDIAPSAPDQYLLFENYPNPFNSSTTIQYLLPRESAGSLTIHNIFGQQVRSLLDNTANLSGKNNVLWNGRDDFGNIVPSGIYFIVLKADDFTQTRRAFLIR